MVQVIVYTTTYCPYCTAAKNFLKKKNISFAEINVEGDQEKRIWLTQTTGQRTVPQIFINNQPIGGYEDMIALEKSGKLDSLLK